MAAGARVKAGGRAKPAAAAVKSHAVSAKISGTVDAAGVIQLLEQAVERRKALAEAQSQLLLFLAPLHAGLGTRELAPIGLAKQFASDLIQIMKLSFGLLDKASVDGCGATEAAECCCIVVKGLSRARLAIKGRPLEVELQTYSLLRKLVAAKRYQAALQMGGLLYASVAGHCRGEVLGHTISESKSGEWPAAPDVASTG
eukprot:scaffold312781_cov39-Prasinocladus_malaysianus.AAC.1